MLRLAEEFYFSHDCLFAVGLVASLELMTRNVFVNDIVTFKSITLECDFKHAQHSRYVFNLVLFI